VPIPKFQRHDDSMPVYLLPEAVVFPSPHLAREDGLLAVGGDLSADRLLEGYRQGIFPWYQDGEPILWWSPDPRLLLYPEKLHIPRSLGKSIRKAVFHITFDTAFESVIAGCAETRTRNREGTWIVADMIQAYSRLHEAGYAHSVEAWKEGELAGGLYGVSLGGAFFGESMFSRVSNASKVALVTLIQRITRWGFDFVDCQISTAHLLQFGACEVPRYRFLQELNVSLYKNTRKGLWK